MINYNATTPDRILPKLREQSPKTKSKFNQSVAEDLKHLMDRFNNEGKFDKFEKYFGYGNVLFHKIQDGEYLINKVLP